MALAKLNLLEITTLDLGTECAKMQLTLETNFLETTFILESTGIFSLDVTGNQSIQVLTTLCDWLKEDSIDKTNMRDNDAEIRIFAKEMIKINNKLKETKTL
tara:strand:- start:390 stop:695 length:306 start_codon:yes stop_codon:yes gene_type:complete